MRWPRVKRSTEVPFRENGSLRVSESKPGRYADPKVGERYVKLESPLFDAYGDLSVSSPPTQKNLQTSPVIPRSFQHPVHESHVSPSSALGDGASIGNTTRSLTIGTYSRWCLSRPVESYQVNYPSLRHLRQQTSYAISRVFVLIPLLQRRAHDLWADRTRLQELDEKAVEFQPLLKDLFSKGLSDVGTDADESEAEWGVDREMLETPMFGGDGLECRSDPCHDHGLKPKNHILEFCHFREVD